MTVTFENCKFCDFKPSHEITFNGKHFTAIDVDITLDSGAKELHTIADYQLEEELYKEFGDDIDDSGIDDTISFYAKEDEYLYDILEQITNEKVKEAKDTDKTQVTDLELLKEYNNLAQKLVELKNDELIFIEDHTNNRDYWSDAQCTEYDDLLKHIFYYETLFNKLCHTVDEHLKTKGLDHDHNGN